MFIAEVKTKDEIRGTLVVAEECIELYGRLTQWAKDLKLKANDIQEADLIFSGTGRSIGLLSFRDDLSVDFTPAIL